MKALIDPSIFLPIGTIVLHLYVILILWIFSLKRLRMLQKPISGLDYSQVIFSGLVLISALLIGLGEIKGLFQVYKTYSNQDQEIFVRYIVKSSQFFLIILFCQVLLALLIWGVGVGLRDLGKGLHEIRNGNLPFGILMGVIILGCSIVLQSLAEYLTDMIVPRILTYN